jgi:hypothetical protein
MKSKRIRRPAGGGAKRHSRRWKFIVAGIVAVSAGVGAIGRITMVVHDRASIVAVYGQVEKLLAVYSLLGWRSEAQLAPPMSFTADYGSSETTLDCQNFKWGTAAVVRRAELLSCFTELTLTRDPLDGDTFRAPRISTAEEFGYSFDWESVFGYEMGVFIGASTGDNPRLSAVRDSLLGPVADACEEEVGTTSSSYMCRPKIYKISLTGLSESRSVTFLAADFRISWLGDGSVDKIKEWVVYFEDGEPITIGQLNKIVQLAARRMGIVDTDLGSVAPRFEALRLASDKQFVKDLLAEIERAPDLVKFESILRGKQ